MINIQIKNCGKEFQKKWVFKSFNHSFEPGTITAITGKNGSGKSTLLKIIAGFVTPSSGTVSWNIPGKKIEQREVYRFISMAAPYMEIIEEFTFTELIRFQNRFKSFQKPLSTKDIVQLSGLKEVINKPVKYFSSGMKQRARLALVLLSNTPLVLLDEPCSNLDSDARAWYAQLLKDFTKDRTVVIASNSNTDEYPYYNNIISL